MNAVSAVTSWLWSLTPWKRPCPRKSPRGRLKVSEIAQELFSLETCTKNFRKYERFMNLMTSQGFFWTWQYVVWGLGGFRLICMTVWLFNKEKNYSFQAEGQTCFRFVLFLPTAPPLMQSSIMCCKMKDVDVMLQSMISLYSLCLLKRLRYLYMVSHFCVSLWSIFCRSFIYITSTWVQWQPFCPQKASWPNLGRAYRLQPMQ